MSTQPLLRRASAHRRAADALAGMFWASSNTTPTTPAASAGDSTFFLESQIGDSQIGDPAVMTYAYTDNPWRLVAYDVWYFFRFAWALPWIVLPLRPLDSDHLDEFAPTRANIFCLVVHVGLAVLQLTFVAALPFGFLLPAWMFVLAVGAFLALNRVLCMSINGDGIEFHSDEEYAVARPEHAHEQWIFVNGVAAGSHWTKANLNRIALTFKRPVLGIHNRTNGVIFDVIECLIQRNFGYATGDVRACYRLVKEKLHDASLSRIVLILHSQGAIEGGLVLDWLLQELPQDLLSKIEVYTFGSAANHFHNPYRHASSQRLVREGSRAASMTAATMTTMNILPEAGTTESPVLSRETTTTTTTSDPSTSLRAAARDRVLGHVEHYAHTTDFVAIWGILHFVRRQPASPTIPRFVGRVFVRSSERGGHQFTQHYLDGMFPLARDAKGNLVGAADESPFMESPVERGVVGAEYETVREALDISYLGDEGGDTQQGAAAAAAAAAAVYGLGGRGVSGRRAGEGLKVKDLSRLWLYRNGRVPRDMSGTVG